MFCEFYFANRLVTFVLFAEDEEDSAQNIIEYHADQIISKMEEDDDLMENNLESEKLRKLVHFLSYYFILC